jgi:hypothetical protein
MEKTEVEKLRKGQLSVETGILVLRKEVSRAKENAGEVVAPSGGKS